MHCIDKMKCVGLTAYGYVCEFEKSRRETKTIFFTQLFNLIALHESYCERLPTWHICINRLMAAKTITYIRYLYLIYFFPPFHFISICTSSIVFAPDSNKNHIPFEGISLYLSSVIYLYLSSDPFQIYINS